MPFTRKFLIGILLIAALIALFLSCTKKDNPVITNSNTNNLSFNLTATLNGDGILLHWSQVTIPKLKNYKIYRSYDSTMSNPVTFLVPPDTDSYLDNNSLWSDSTYYYRMSVIDSSSLEAGAPDSNYMVDIKITGSNLCTSDTTLSLSGAVDTSSLITVSNCNNPSQFKCVMTKNVDWLHLTKDSLVVPSTFAIFTDSNNTGVSRTGQVILTALESDISPDTLFVTQSLSGANLCVSESAWQAPSTGGSSNIINITNCGNSESFYWGITNIASWLSISSSTGTTPGSFIITADSNTTGSNRTDTLIIIANGINGSPKTIIVTQYTIGPALCLSDSVWQIPDTGGTKNIDITNCGNSDSFNWTISNGDSWVTITPSSGTTPGNISITVDSNLTGSSRYVNITVTATGVNGSPKVITLAQPSISTLCLSDSTWQAPSTGGTSSTINITNCGNSSSFNWNAGTSTNWITVNQTSGITPGSLTLTVDSNLTGSLRTGTVTITADVKNSPKTITVTQAGVRPTLCVSEISWQAPQTGDSKNINITNCGNNETFSWTVTDDANWITVSPLSGGTPGSFTITADSNTTGSDRNGTVTVTASGIEGSPQTISITQSSQPAILCVSDSIWLTPDSGGTHQINVTNCGNSVAINWSVSTDSSWLSISPTTGTTLGNFTITADTNLSGTARTAIVQVTGNVGRGVADGSPRNIIVTQPNMPRLQLIGHYTDNYVGGSSHNLAGARKIAMQGNYVYISNAVKGVQIIDVSNPTAPSFVGNYAKDNDYLFPYNIAITDNILFLTYEISHRIDLIDVSNKYNPTLLNSILNDTVSFNIFPRSYSSSFIVTTPKGFQRYSYSPNINVIDDYHTNNWGACYDFNMNGYRYLACDSGLIMLDFEPNDSIVGAYHTNTRAYVIGKNTNAFLLGTQNSLLSFDILADSLILQDSYSLSSPVHDISSTLYGNYAFLANYYDGIKMIDVSDPSNLKLVGSHSSFDASTGIVVSGDYVYVADNGGGLMILKYIP